MSKNVNSENVASSLRFGGASLTKSLEGFSGEEWFQQPNATTNHLMFMMGHVVVVRGMALRLLGAEWSAPWEALFGRGAVLTSREKYPPVKEILAAWEDLSRRVPEAVEAATPEKLASAPPPHVPTFDGTLGGVIAFLAAHEWYHVGQVAYLARWFGHGAVSG